jgi:hypothetical protein
MNIHSYEVSVISERRSRAGAVAVVRDSYSVRAGAAAQAELEALQAHWAKYPDTRDAMMTGCRRLPGR